MNVETVTKLFWSIRCKDVILSICSCSTYKIIKKKKIDHIRNSILQIHFSFTFKSTDNTEVIIIWPKVNFFLIQKWKKLYVRWYNNIHTFKQLWEKITIHWPTNLGKLWYAKTKFLFDPYLISCISCTGCQQITSVYKY